MSLSQIDDVDVIPHARAVARGIVAAEHLQLVTATDRHLREQPAVTCRPVGQGHVIYVGTYLEAPVFGALWETIAKLSGVEPQWPDLPPAVEVVRRQSSEKTLWFFMNHADHPVVLPSPPKGRNLVTDEEANGDSLELEGYGVAAIKEG